MNLETCGIDIAEEAARIAHDVSPHSDIIVGRGEELPFADESFDLVVCLGALEHFLDMAKATEEMKRVGSADARYCIVVPNINFIFWRMRCKPGTEQREIKESILTFAQWKRILSGGGLQVRMVFPDRWRWATGPFRRSLITITDFIMTMIWMTLPIRWTYQFVLICQKDKMASKLRSHNRHGMKGLR